MTRARVVKLILQSELWHNSAIKTGAKLLIFSCFLGSVDFCYKSLVCVKVKQKKREVSRT